MVPAGQRRTSRVEFDNTYFAIDEDIERLIETNFGLKGEQLERYKGYIERKSVLLEQLSQSLFLHLKIANGLYPQCVAHLDERRAHQKEASGICYGIAALYERIFHHIGISRDKHVQELEHIQKEINSIKAWRDSDTKRFKF